MHKENKCSKLFDPSLPKMEDPLVQIFKMQEQLQDFLAKKGRAIDYRSASFKDRVDDITIQWRNMNTEMTELLDRLPWKEWKTYSDEQLTDFIDDEHMLEVYYEYVDVFHFFVNVGLALGIDGEILEKLYYTKNKENFDRQDRGY